jgi:hypothetical protein
MNKLAFIFLTFLLGATSTFAVDLKTSKVEKIVNRLAKKNAVFFSEHKGESYFLGGTWKKKFPAKGFSGREVEILLSNVKKEEVYDQLMQLKKEGHDLFVRKGKKTVTLHRASRKITYRMDKLPSAKKTARKVMRKTICPLCQIKLAGNYVSVDGANQINPEVSWVPFYMFNDNFGLSFPMSWSIYSTENDQLEEEFSSVLKAQALLRYYIRRVYIEVGGGVNHFLSFSDTSSVMTFGIGNVFKEKRWIISDELSFTGLHFYHSRVQWTREIAEFKLGINFSF